MVLREWQIRIPTPHTVRLESRLLETDLLLSVDGRVHAAWSRWSHPPQIEPIVVDGVSYTLSRSLPGFRGRYRLFRTEDIPRIPQELRSSSRMVIILVYSFAFSAASLMAVCNAKSIAQYFAVDRENELLVNFSLAGLSVVAMTAFLGSAYRLREFTRKARDANAIDLLSPQPAPMLGTQPRTGAYFRPLLADIAATAARWKRRLLGFRESRQLDRR